MGMGGGPVGGGAATLAALDLELVHRDEVEL
eukprot:CAMPEP_0177612306 /NCGR_PEP_ID=MMETSP0419_2-20121207/21128_1 /TAXON_ID=582737 /ORGANISM="Tetraselmis sp., Strain GSL018" /LENGTH=30 /DNA_ID= /DNA_START= /DNA_END= /DNA_ORIENTATION=